MTKDHPHAQQPLTRGVHHVGLAVPDIELARSFFCDALGYKTVGGNAASVGHAGERLNGGIKSRYDVADRVGDQLPGRVGDEHGRRRRLGRGDGE